MQEDESDDGTDESRVFAVAAAPGTWTYVGCGRADPATAAPPRSAGR